MERNGEEAGRNTPPYIPLQTLTGFIDQLKSTALPPRIDNSVMHGKSGATQTGLRSAMRFLGLIHSNGAVTDALRRLVKVYGTEEWKEAFGEVVSDAFATHLTDLDLEVGTAAQLRETFKNNLAVEGQMLEKAVRFYLSAMDEAGWTYSPHFRRPTGSGTTRNRQATKSPRKRRSGNSADAPLVVKEEKTPPGMVEFVSPIPRKHKLRAIVPEDVTLKEWELLDAQVRGFIGLRGVLADVKPLGDDEEET